MVGPCVSSRDEGVGGEITLWQPLEATLALLLCEISVSPVASTYVC